MEKAEKRETIKYWNKLKYYEVKRDKEANVIKYYEEEKEYMWIVSFEITEKNRKEIIYYGRQRWKIENEGFKEQKKGTFDIEHVYTRNYNGIKGHYFFIQFAHTIRQLLEKGVKEILELKMSKKEVSATITQALTHTTINLTEQKKIQLRFNTG